MDCVPASKSTSGPEVSYYFLVATVTEEHLYSACPVPLRPKRNLLTSLQWMSMYQAVGQASPHQLFGVDALCLFSRHVSGSPSVYTDICFCSVLCFLSQLPLLLRWTVSVHQEPSLTWYCSYSMFVNSQNCNDLYSLRESQDSVSWRNRPARWDLWEVGW